MKVYKYTLDLSTTPVDGDWVEVDGKRITFDGRTVNHAAWKLTKELGKLGYDVSLKQKPFKVTNKITVTTEEEIMVSETLTAAEDVWTKSVRINER